MNVNRKDNERRRKERAEQKRQENCFAVKKSAEIEPKQPAMTKTTNERTKCR